jgi:hypothetical protein
VKSWFSARIVGSVLVGGGLVAGAWTLNSLQAAPPTVEGELAAAITSAPPRESIPVADSDGDGIEDWQEPLLTAAPVILSSTEAAPTSTTLTDRISVSLMEQFLLAQSTGANPAESDLTTISLATLQAAAADTVYTAADLTISTDSSPEAIALYAESIAKAFALTSKPGLKNELLLFEEALSTGNDALLRDISTIATIYIQNREIMLRTPVPAPLADAHLAILNAFHGLAGTITAFANVREDPMLSLARLQRYQSDASALVTAMRGMYEALRPYPGMFTDLEKLSTVLFVGFAARPPVVPQP